MLKRDSRVFGYTQKKVLCVPLAVWGPDMFAPRGDIETSRVFAYLGIRIDSDLHEPVKPWLGSMINQRVLSFPLLYGNEYL